MRALSCCGAVEVLPPLQLRVVGDSDAHEEARTPAPPSAFKRGPRVMMLLMGSARLWNPTRVVLPKARILR